MGLKQKVRQYGSGNGGGNTASDGNSNGKAMGQSLDALDKCSLKEEQAKRERTKEKVRDCNLLPWPCEAEPGQALFPLNSATSI